MENRKAVYFDTHAHLYDNRFDGDRQQVIEQAIQQGVEYMLIPSDTILTSQLSLDLAKKHKNMYCAVGVHPHDSKDMDEDSLLTLELMAMDPKVKAIGEIGLDYYWDNSPRDVQAQRFREQIRLARKLKLPIIIHDRDAHQDVLDILKEEKGFENGLVMHSYSGSVELARQYVKLGAYISLSGPVTFKNAPVKGEVAKTIPLERIFIETDSPYLTPVPYRGKRNEPAYVIYVAEKIAEIKGISVEEVAAQTTENALKFFGIAG